MMSARSCASPLGAGTGDFAQAQPLMPALVSYSYGQVAYCAL